jgi:hypothetical protein
MSTPIQTSPTSSTITSNRSPSGSIGSSSTSPTTPTKIVKLKVPANSPTRAIPSTKLKPTDFEALLEDVHAKAKKTAQKDSTADEVVLAKLACYALRELHAEGIVSPPLFSSCNLLDFINLMLMNNDSSQ